MTDNDAAIGRKLMVDELNTVNEYEAMADHASPEVAKVVRDVADEEKVHAGEGAAIVGEHDPRAEPAMREGLEEAEGLMKSAPGFEQLLEESFAKRRINSRNQETTGSFDRYNKDLETRGLPSEKPYLGKYRPITYRADGQAGSQWQGTRAVSGGTAVNRKTTEKGTLTGGEVGLTRPNQRAMLARGDLEYVIDPETGEKVKDELGRALLRNTRTGQTEIEQQTMWDRVGPDGENMRRERAYDYYTHHYKNDIANPDRDPYGSFETFYELEWPNIEHNKSYDSDKDSGVDEAGIAEKNAQTIQELRDKAAILMDKNSNAYKKIYADELQRNRLRPEDILTVPQQNQLERGVQDRIALALSKAYPGHEDEVKRLIYRPEKTTAEMIDSADTKVIQGSQEYQDMLNSGMSPEEAVASVREWRDNEEQAARNRAQRDEEYEAQNRKEIYDDQMDKLKQMRDRKDELTGQVSEGVAGATQITNAAKAAMAKDPASAEKLERLNTIANRFDPNDPYSWRNISDEDIEFVNALAGEINERFNGQLPREIGKLTGHSKENPIIPLDMNKLEESRYATAGTDLKSNQIKNKITTLRRALELDPEAKTDMAIMEDAKQMQRDAEKARDEIAGIDAEAKKMGLGTEDQYSGAGHKGSKPSDNTAVHSSNRPVSNADKAREERNASNVYPAKQTVSSARDKKVGETSEHAYDADSAKDKKQEKKEHKQEVEKDAQKDAEMTRDSKIKPNRGANKTRETNEDQTRETMTELEEKGFTEPTKKSASFEELLTESIAKKSNGDGKPNMSADELIRDPWRKVNIQVNDQVNVNGNDGKHITNGEGISVKAADKNDGVSGAVDEPGTQPKRDVPDDGGSGTVSKSFEDLMVERNPGTFVKSTDDKIESE